MADEGGYRNTSITSACCHKTVKQNQSHVELAGFLCVHTLRHTHASTTSPVKPDRQILSHNWTLCKVLLKLIGNILCKFYIILAVHFLKCMQTAYSLNTVFSSEPPKPSIVTGGVPASGSKEQEAIKTCT